jgi:hypothetical protein
MIAWDARFYVNGELCNEVSCKGLKHEEKEMTSNTKLTRALVITTDNALELSEPQLAAFGPVDWSTRRRRVALGQ